MPDFRLSRRDFLRLAAGSAGALVAGAVPVLGQTVTEPTAAGLAYSGALRMWDWNFDPRQAYFAELINAWQGANEGIQIDYTNFPYGDLQTRLLTSIDAGDNPPLSNVHVNWRYELQKAGRLLPYPEDLFDFDSLISTPFNRDPQTGDIFTSTFGFYGDVVFYNRDILAEAGIAPEDVPTNWDDFLALGRELTVRDARGFVTRPGIALNHYFSQEWLWHSLVYQQDAFLYNETGDEALWNSEAGIEALELIRAWFNDEPLDDINLLRHFEQFANGEAAMFISHGYWTNSLRVEYPDLNWGALPLPTFTGEALPSYGMQLPEEGLAVFTNATAEEREAAFNFIQYTLQPQEHRTSWAQLLTIPPDATELLSEDVIAQIDTQNVINALAQTLPYRVSYGERPIEAEPLWRTMFEEVIINNTNPREALDTATAAMNEAFADRGRSIITERNYSPPEA